MTFWTFMDRNAPGVVLVAVIAILAGGSLIAGSRNHAERMAAIEAGVCPFEVAP